jgi:hypothetical protein
VPIIDLPTKKKRGDDEHLNYTPHSMKSETKAVNVRRTIAHILSKNEPRINIANALPTLLLGTRLVDTVSLW